MIIDAADALRKTHRVDALILLAAALLGLVLFREDTFDRLYAYTRAHEQWELDEYIIVAVSILVGSMVISIRHLFLLRNANQLIRKFQAEKSHAEKMAALGEMSSGLAHEINNALQPAIGLSEIIRKKISPHDAQAAGYMDIIFNSSRHAKKIVEDILLFSRGQSYECEIMDACPLLDRIAAEIKESIPASVSLHVSNTSTADLPIFANETSIRQIMMNLVQNACHALPGQAGNIWIRLHEKLPPFSTAPVTGRYACIEIKDDGKGIDPDMMPLIFEPFFTTKDNGKGTGLGLSVVHGIVKSLGGSIDVKSEPGKGATFAIFLPLVKKGAFHE